VVAKRRVPDRVDTGMDLVQAAGRDPAADRLPAQPEPEQLCRRDDAVLARRERRDRSITPRSTIAPVPGRIVDLGEDGGDRRRLGRADGARCVTDA